MKIIIKQNTTQSIIEADLNLATDFVIEILVEENAVCDYVSASCVVPNLVRKFILEKNAILNFSETNFFSSGINNSDTEIVLRGRGAKCEFKSALLAGGNWSGKITQNIFHEAPETISSILARAAFFGTARGEFDSSVQISKSATQSSGREDIKILLCSPNASVKTIPNLAIYNQDVVCSHAASIRRLQPRDYYLFSLRGLPAQMAQTEMVLAHLFSSFDLSEIEREEWTNKLLEVY